MYESLAYRPLALRALAAAPSLPQWHDSVALYDPATSVLTDLRHGARVTVDRHDGLAHALSVMQKAGVRMAFVAGVEGELIGLVTAEDLQGQHLRHDELTLADVMLPVSHWQVVDYLQLAQARVGDIVQTFQQSGLRYLLVTEQVDGQTALRGIFSARRIELALKTPIEQGLHSRSFAELGAALQH
jgi:CBS domain-containing protein